MKIKELKAVLDDYDEEMYIQVEVRGEDIEDGDLLDVADERSVTVMYGKLTITADKEEEE